MHQTLKNLSLKVALDFQREFGKNKEDGHCENKGDDPRNGGDNEGD